MVATLLFFASLAASPALEQAYTGANAAFEEGRYQEAARMYGEIIDAGIADAAVFYSLGNARFRLGELGPAIANYERALQLDPRFEGAQENLRYAVAATQHRLARPLRDSWREALLFWDNNLRPAEARWGGLLLWAAFWGVVLARYLRRDRRLTAAAVLLLLASTALLTSSFAKQFPLPLAVASAEAVAVRTGMSPDDTVRYELQPGDRVRIQDTRPGWLLVSTVNGDRGWACAEAFTLVGPPYQTQSNEAAAP